MDKDERELDRLVKELEEDDFVGTPPLFELTVTVISLLLTITLFIYPNMLLKGYEAYEIMLQVMPNYLWGLTFFIAAMLKGIGLLLDVKFMRISGLVMSAVIYFIVSLSFSVDFPAMSAITYGVLSVFSVVSISQVRSTSIINRRGDKK